MATTLPGKPAVHAAIDAVWRLEAAKVIAVVARLTRDVGVAEELAQDALLAALEHWPQDGVPYKPGAWLTATAKRRALDHLRHQAMAAKQHDAIGQDLQAQEAAFVPSVIDTLIGGLSTAEIARAFLVSEATVAQRIVRAKRSLSEAKVPYELPPRQ